MTNKQIALALNETSALIDLTGGNTFRARAFANAARTIERMDEQAVDLLAHDELSDVRGIGKGLSAQISELVSSGTFELRDELIGSIPPGVLEMLRIKGIGAKKARAIWQTLDITSVDQLEEAAMSGRLAGLPGFGAKTEAKIVAAIQAYQRYSSSRRYASVMRELAPVVARLETLDGVERVEFSGAVRRNMEIVTSADLVLIGDADTIASNLSTVLPSAEAVGGRTRSFLSALPDGLPLQIQIVAPSESGSALFLGTGSAEFLEAWQDAFGEIAPAPDEAAVFAAAGIQEIPPELREGIGAIEAARSHSIPTLVSVANLRGSVHNHSTYSDGAHSLHEMAEACRAMGLEYFGICDHSRSLTIANGLSIERVAEQQREIARLNEAYRASGDDFRILSGIESDILRDGSLDYPDDVLATFDLVVASVHSHFGMTRDEATARIIRAVENPYTTILGHMTGRLLLSREGYPVDHLRIIDACAANGVAIELNANPHRLDMDWRFIQEATERGVLISINPDAHSTDELHYVHWGVAVARKGWLQPAQCLNAFTRNEFESWLEARRPS